jgi:hypothetical protein
MPALSVLVGGYNNLGINVPWDIYNRHECPPSGGTLLSGMSDPRGHSVQSILSPFKEDTDHGVDSSHECPPLEGTGDTYSVEWCKRLHCPLGAIVPLPSNKKKYIYYFSIDQKW